ncbi:MAG: CBS domain-containing protein [Planctomycetota bacterium]
MTVGPVTLKPETHIFEAIKALIDRSISGATVVDDQGQVVGVISEMDCLQAVLSNTYHGDAGGTVADIMTTEVETVEEGANVLDVAKKLIEGHRRRFPVVQEGRFVGQVSCRSILKAVVEFAETPRPKKD